MTPYQRRTQIGFAIFLLPLLANLGGCPAGNNVSLPTEMDDTPLQLFGQTDDDENIVVAADLGDVIFDSYDFEFAARKGTSAQIILESPPENPAEVDFRLLSVPEFGVVSEMRKLGPNRAAFDYSPPFDFTGIARFQYIVEHVDGISDVAEIAVLIHPEIRFSVVDVPQNRGVIHVKANTRSGEPLPQARYFWQVDDEEIEREVRANAMIALDPGTAGQHSVGLVVQYPNMRIKVSGIMASGDTTARVQTVPRTFGSVRDGNDQPLANVRVHAQGDPAVTVTTDDAGSFALPLPAGWNGEVRIDRNTGLQIVPSRYIVANIEDNRENFDFVVFGVTTPGDNTPPTQNEDPNLPNAPGLQIASAEDDTAVIEFSLPAGEASIELVSLPTNGVLRDLRTNSAIFVQQLPYILPQRGTAVEYFPGPNFAGEDAFAYRYHEAGFGGADGTVAISISEVNDPPIMIAGAETLLATSLDVPRPRTVAAADVDAVGDELTWQVVVSPQHGAVAFDNTQTASGVKTRFVYTPGTGYVGNDRFTVECADSFGAAVTTEYAVTVSASAVLANAGDDALAYGFEAVTLSAEESLAPEGATFQWRQISGPTVEIIDADSMVARFRIPPILETTDFEFEVEVAFSAVTSTDRVSVSAEFSRQALVYAIDAALQRFWETRVEFNIDGDVYSGFASMAALDNGPGFWGDESGSPSHHPLWDFQGRDGVGGALFAHVMAYQATGNKLYLRRAQAIGDALLAAQEAHGGGWYQDMSYVNGEWKNVSVWGTFGANFHTPDIIQDLYTLDDSTSQGCALALLRLYEAGGGSRFLTGARNLGDELAELKDITYQGVQPYATGGIPQVLPLSRALAADYNQNQDPRNPDGPYMPNKTNNDNTMSDAIVFLMELHRVTGLGTYRDAVELNVDFLLDRHAAYGHRGWAQQYDFMTDEIAWGRHKEPPAYVTCENNVVDALLLWRSRSTNAARIANIEYSIQKYVDWLRDDIPRPANEPNKVWRYYNHDESTGDLNLPVFADDYVRYVGAQFESNAGSGQPYRGTWDAKWILRLDADEPNGLVDFSRAANYLNNTANDPIGVTPTNWQYSYTTQDAGGAWPTTANVGGESRVALSTSGTLLRIYGMTYRANQLTDPIVDADADGYDNDVEIGAGSDPFDSESVPPPTATFGMATADDADRGQEVAASSAVTAASTRSHKK